MGLCKCPKKIVTNQFCFEHRVNVCEYCMVTEHKTCIVQSYLLWLQDCEYDPNCQLCQKELVEDDNCIRLTCYHVYHWTCLNKYANNLPLHTAPAGYTCPICNVGIFPPQNMVSPIAETLRNTLLGVNWARCGLAFPLVDETSPPVPSSTTVKESPRKVIARTEEQVSKSVDQKALYTSVPNMAEVTHISRPEPYGASFNSGHFAGARKMYDSTDSGLFKPSVVDHDENKYKRRSAFEMINRWIHSKTMPSKNRRDTSVVYKKRVVLGMLGLIGLCTLIIIFLRLGRSSADSDPMLDPHFNPNIHVEDNVNIVQDTAKIMDNGKEMPVDDANMNILPR